MAIVLKPKASVASVVVKDGTYQAELTGIRQFANAYGDRIGFEFTIQGGQFDGVAVMRSTAPQLTQQSKLAEVLIGLMGRELKQAELAGGIDIEELIGTQCQILVLQSKSKTGAVYSNVERVFSAA
jgi:uncharacterized Ntn-hydrolase superfamily protein